MKILIAEDEKLIADQLIGQLHDIGYSAIELVSNSTDAILSFNKTEPDLVILDIGLRDSKLDGIDLSKKLQTIRPFPCIFLSGFSDDATLSRVKSVPHSDFLVKPCSTRQLYVSIDRAIDNFAEEQSDSNQISACHYIPTNDSFFVRGTNGAYEKVTMKTLQWIESVRGGCEIYVESGKHYMLTASLNSFLLQFQHSSLTRVHRSYVVNRDNVIAHKDKSLIFNIGGVRKNIPCSQAYWAEIKNQFKTLKSD